VGELPHIVTSLLELPLQRGKYRAGAGFRQLADRSDAFTRNSRWRCRPATTRARSSGARAPRGFPQGHPAGIPR
jgi:hypothetical protein